MKEELTDVSPPKSRAKPKRKPQKRKIRELQLASISKPVMASPPEIENTIAALESSLPASVSKNAVSKCF
jgi:hypothetical protein